MTRREAAGVAIGVLALAACGVGGFALTQHGWLLAAITLVVFAAGTAASNHLLRPRRTR